MRRKPPTCTRMPNGQRLHVPRGIFSRRLLYSRFSSLGFKIDFYGISSDDTRPGTFKQTTIEKSMNANLDPYDESEILVGHLHLLWSLYLPAQQGSNVAISPDDFKAGLLEWISEEFLCGGHFSSFGVELVSSMGMESDCDSTSSDWSSFPPTILWNSPSATASFHSLSGTDQRFSTWNATFPVYEWGDSEGIQEQLQTSLDGLIKSGKLETPLEASMLAVVGEEDQVFSQFDSSSHSIDPSISATLQLIGGVALIVHTVFLLIIYVAGKVYGRCAKRRRERGKVFDVEAIDDMLCLSKDLVPSSPPSSVLLTMPYINNSGTRQPPGRKHRSAIAQPGSAQFSGESLLPPMDAHDDISEAGTEVLLGSVASGSCHIVDDDGSVLSVVQLHDFDVDAGDSESSSHHSAGAAISSPEERIARPLLGDMNTVLGNPYNFDDDEHNDILIF